MQGGCVPRLCAPFGGEEEEEEEEEVSCRWIEKIEVRHWLNCRGGDSGSSIGALTQEHHGYLVTLLVTF